MSPIGQVAYSCWTRFLGGKKKCNILILPEELIVDEIFQYLTVYDIIRLRRVCKPLSVMTKKAAVWKRLLPHLSQIDQPLAPLPPTKAYNMHNLTALDIETVVLRALSYDIAWKKKRILPYSHFGGLSFHAVTDISLLPGGHFMVTSQIYDHAEFGKVHVVNLWSVQHPATTKPAPIAFRITSQPVYGLTAKYMTINGVKGIAVGFLRKKNKDPKDPRRVPLNFELGGKKDAEDPFQPLKYECTVLFMRMDIIDALTDRNIAPQTREFDAVLQSLLRKHYGDIWNVVGRVRTASQMGGLSLDRIDGRPYLCLLKRPNTIVFQCLEDGVKSSITCRNLTKYLRNDHAIYNFRVLPEQRQVLVVRNIARGSRMKTSHTSFELHDIPQPGDNNPSSPNDEHILEDDEYINVKISETYRKMPTHEDESINPYLSQDHIPPVSVYVRTELDMAHYAIYPSAVESTPSPSEMASPPSPSTEGSMSDTLYKIPPRKFVYDFCRIKKHDICFKDGEREPYDMEEYETQLEKDAADRGEWTFPVDFRSDDHLRFLPGSTRCIFYQIPRRWTSIDPPVTNVYGYEVDPVVHARFDKLAHLDIRDAVFYDEVININNNEHANGHVTQNREEELEVMMMLKPGERERNKYRHPTLDFPAASMDPKRDDMPVIDLGYEFYLVMGHGVHAMAYDEDVGRLVVASKKDRKFHVFDFAYNRKKDEEDALVSSAMGMSIG